MKIICEYCNSEINANSNNCPYCLKEKTKEISDITDLNSLIDSILSQKIVKQLISETEKSNSILYVFLLSIIIIFLPMLLTIIFK